jgi:AraC-like DNA-binding protein
MATWSSSVRPRRDDPRITATAEWYAPPASLAPTIKDFWVFRGAPTTPDILERVLPDGSVALIIALGDGGGEIFARGPIARGHTITFSAARSYVAVRLRAGIAAHLFRLDAASLTTLRVPLRDLSECVLKTELGRVALPSQPREALAAIRPALERSLSTRDLEHGTALSRLVAQLETTLNPSSPSEIAILLGTSDRTLRRRMLAEIGLTPKRYLRALRVRRALALLARDGVRAAARVALEVGYSDQAHLCRDFEALLGCGPSTCLDLPVTEPLTSPLAVFPAASSEPSCS